MGVNGAGGRPCGLPKTGGRQRGTPNKATLTAAEILEALPAILSRAWRESQWTKKIRRDQGSIFQRTGTVFVPETKAAGCAGRTTYCNECDHQA